MAKKRVALDECISDPTLARLFGAKAHVYTARDLGVVAKDDTRFIDRAVARKCLIVTVNDDFVDYYRKHPLREGRRGTFFYGLIFLKNSKVMPREEQLKNALKAIDWNDTRHHDDLILVSATGKTKHERLCHPECAAEFPKDQTRWD